MRPITPAMPMTPTAEPEVDAALVAVAVPVVLWLVEVAVPVLVPVPVLVEACVEAEVLEPVTAALTKKVNICYTSGKLRFLRGDGSGQRSGSGRRGRAVAHRVGLRHGRVQAAMNASQCSRNRSKSSESAVPRVGAVLNDLLAGVVRLAGAVLDHGGARRTFLVSGL